MCVCVCIQYIYIYIYIYIYNIYITYILFYSLSWITERNRPYQYNIQGLHSIYIYIHIYIYSYTHGNTHKHIHNSQFCYVLSVLLTGLILRTLTQKNNREEKHRPACWPTVWPYISVIMGYYNIIIAPFRFYGGYCVL